jgi:apolipoprotein N-acyltransferase
MHKVRIAYTRNMQEDESVHKSELGEVGKAHTYQTSLLLLLLAAVGASLVGVSMFYPVVAPLAWFGLAPYFYILVRETSVRRSIIYGFLVGISIAIPALAPLSSLKNWSWEDAPLWLANSPSLAWLSIVLLYVFFWGGVMYALQSALIVQLAQSAWVRAALIPLVWFLVEFLRATVLDGLTWGHIGYSQAYIEPLAAWASLGTVYLVGAIVISINVSIVLIALQWPHFRSYVWAIVLFGLTVMIGGYILSTQIPQAHSWSGREIVLPYTTEISSDIEVFEEILATTEIVLREPPHIAILPENTFPYFIIDRDTKRPAGYEEGGEIAERFDRLLKLTTNEQQSTILLGMHTAYSKERRYNSLVVIQNGAIEAWYDKRKLLPFGERSVAFLYEYDLGYTAGSEPRELLVGDTAVVPYICSEVFYLDQSRRGGSAVVVVSNDTIFSSPLVTSYSNAVATLRAIEARAPLVRARKVGEE